MGIIISSFLQLHSECLLWCADGRLWRWFFAAWRVGIRNCYSYIADDAISSRGNRRFTC